MPVLRVETITFRGSDPNILPLLVRQAPIAGPEWTRAGARLPAAIAAAPGVTQVAIGVTFSSPDLAGQTISVFASRLSGGGHALQDVAPASVTFDAAGRSRLVQFRAAVARRVVEIDHVRWQWKFRDAVGTHDSVTTEHDIAVVLDHPRSPWTTRAQAPADLSHPWWEVLKVACAAATGATTLDDAAARITHQAFDEWGGRFYVWNSGAETFASNSGDSPLAFDCARFLALIGSPPPAAREIVDCSDMAAIVSTFAAALGAAVAQLTLWQGLSCRATHLVGKSEWEFDLGFPLHELSVSDPLDADPRMWDACLMITEDERVGQGEPVVQVLPAGVRASDYLRHLLSADRLPFEEHIRRGPLTRPVRPLSERLMPPQWDEHLDQVARLYELDVAPPPALRRVPAFDPLDVAGADWRARADTPFPPSGAAEPGVDAVARIAYTSVSDPARQVRATIYLSRDAAAAQRRLVMLLGNVSPRFERFDAGPGLAFISPDRKTIVGAVMNVAYRIADVGEFAANAGPDARRLRSLLTERLAVASQPL